MRKSLIRIAGVLALAGISTSAISDEIVVIVNANSPAASMSAVQVAELFLGKDTSLEPVDLPEGLPVRDQFYAKVAGKDALQVKTIWTRLIFTGSVAPPKQARTSADAVKLVAGNARAIAYVEKSAVDASVKTVLTVN